MGHYVPRTGSFCMQMKIISPMEGFARDRGTRELGNGLWAGLNVVKHSSHVMC